MITDTSGKDADGERDISRMNVLIRQLLDIANDSEDMPEITRHEYVMTEE